MRARRSWNGMEIAARAGCGRIVCPDTDSDGLRVNEFARDAFFTMQLHKRGSSCSQRKNKICWRNSQHVRKRLDKVGGLGGWVIRMGWSHAKRISCRIASLDIPQKGWLWKISAGILNSKHRTTRVPFYCCRSGNIPLSIDRIANGWWYSRLNL